MSIVIQVMPTMECEPPQSTISEYANQKSPTGPESWASGERSVRSYVSILDEHDLDPTFFIHPEVAEYHAELFRDLEADGACLGLHVHPYKLDPEYTSDLGVYSEAVQTEILRRAVDQWEAAIGHHPRVIRTGGCSANDNTFRVLESLGFVGGSVSVPGCVWPAYAAAWVGAEPYPHRAHRQYRLMRGKSEFIEVPYLTDFSRPTHTNEFDRSRGYEPPYLAGESQDSDLHETTGYPVGSITEHLVSRFVSDGPAVPTFAPHVHNNVDFGQQGSPAAQNVEIVMRTLRACESDLDIEAVSATLASVIETTRAIV